jgi:hypothetical protein
MVSSTRVKSIKGGSFCCLLHQLNHTDFITQKGKIIMKLLWILAGLALMIDATYSVPVETETTEGNTYACR